MAEAPAAHPIEAPGPVPAPAPPLASDGFELMPDSPPPGLVRRFFTIHRHLIGLALGGLVAHVREGIALGGGRKRGLRLLFQVERLLAALVRPFLDRTLVDRPFPVQLRRRLEIQILKPGLDVAAVSQEHINKIFLHQFSPLRMARDGLRGAPEVIDAIAKAPMLVTEGLRLLEQVSRRPSENPLAGLRGTLFGGFCMVAGAVLAASGGAWYFWAPLFVLGIMAALHRGR